MRRSCARRPYPVAPIPPDGLSPVPSAFVIRALLVRQVAIRPKDIGRVSHAAHGSSLKLTRPTKAWEFRCWRRFSLPGRLIAPVTPTEVSFVPPVQSTVTNDTPERDR